MKGQETYPVWSPGFSRRDVGNFDDCEMFGSVAEFVGDCISNSNWGLEEHELRLWIANSWFVAQWCSGSEFFALAVACRGIPREQGPGPEPGPDRVGCNRCNPRTVRCSGCTPAEPYPPNRKRKLTRELAVGKPRRDGKNAGLQLFDQCRSRSNKLNQKTSDAVGS